MATFVFSELRLSNVAASNMSGQPQIIFLPGEFKKYINNNDVTLYDNALDAINKIKAFVP